MPVYGQDLSPKIFYLFTSSDKDYQSHFSQRPMPAPMQKDEKPQELDASIVKCFAYLNASVHLCVMFFYSLLMSASRKYGFLDYVQLHAEDFED